MPSAIDLGSDHRRGDLGDGAAALLAHQAAYVIPGYYRLPPCPNTSWVIVGQACANPKRDRNVPVGNDIATAGLPRVPGSFEPLL
jgi:hypothetical protein